MNLCIDCKFREPGQWLTPLCNRPVADTSAELVCAKERHGRDDDACGQIGKYFQPAEPTS